MYLNELTDTCFSVLHSTGQLIIINADYQITARVRVGNAEFAIGECEKAPDEPLPVKRTDKKYKVFPTSSHSLLAAFYAARQSACFSIGVSRPRLRWTRLVL